MSYAVSNLPMVQKRPRRWGFRRRMRSGQTLVIFALSFTVLLAMAGLVIDVGRAYDLYAQMQRAAEAGALAGVLYMPTYYDSPSPSDNNSAVSRAAQEVVQNGFATPLATMNMASGCIPGAAVSICQVTGATDDLQVSVTQTLDLVLLSGLGAQPITLTATAQADYLPPVQLGGRLNYLGDKPDNLQSFMASFNGPSELKENGDPYVYCEEGSAYTATPDGSTDSWVTYNGVSTNLPQNSPNPPPTPNILNYCGVPNLPDTPGNSDQQPSGYSGTATTGTVHPGGYNYLVDVPQSVTGGADIWVFNPSFIPCDTNCGGANFDHFDLSEDSGDSTYYVGPGGTGIQDFSGLHDAPPFYFDITYSLYTVNSLYDRSSSTDVQWPSSGSSVTYHPYDAMSNDLAAEGCGSGQVYDPNWGFYSDLPTTPNSYNPPVEPGNGCFSLSPGTDGSAPTWDSSAPDPCWQQWCTVFTGVPAGTYRLVIEATGLDSTGGSGATAYSSDITSGYGTHVYALKVCQSGLITPVSCPAGGLQIAAWNDMDVYFNSNLSKNGYNSNDPSTTCVNPSAPINYAYACLDLACIPTVYAGRTLTVQIFDPGDFSTNDVYVGVAEAGVGTADVAYPGLATTSLDDDTVVQVHFTSPDYDAFHGIWLTAQVTLPSTYTGDCQTTGWWQLMYSSESGDGVPNDQIGVKVSLAGSPVHLVTPT